MFIDLGTPAVKLMLVDLVAPDIAGAMATRRVPAGSRGPADIQKLEQR